MRDDEKRHLSLVREEEALFQTREGGIPRLWDHPIVFKAQGTQDEELQALESYHETLDALENGSQILVHYLNDEKRQFSPPLPHLEEFFNKLKTYYEGRGNNPDIASLNARNFMQRDLKRLVPSLRNTETLVRSSDATLDLVEGTSKEFLFKILLNILRWGEDHLQIPHDYIETRKEVIEWYLKSDTYGQILLARADLKVH